MSTINIYKKTYANSKRLEKRVIGKSVAKSEKPKKSSKKQAPTKRATAKDEGDPLSMKRKVTSDLLVEWYNEDSEVLVEIDEENCGATMEEAMEESMEELMEDSTEELMEESTEEPAEYDGDVVTILKKILERQNRLELRMFKLEATIKALLTSNEENKLSKTEEKERDKVVRECKKLTQKVHKAVSQFTGDDENKPQIDIGASLPISTLKEANDVDEKMRDKTYYYAMKMYLKTVKSTGTSFEAIVRKLYSDKFLAQCNWEGKCGKYALMKFSLAGDLLYGCSGFADRGDFDAAIRKCISKSHHRMEQRRHNDRLKTKKSKLK